MRKILLFFTLILVVNTMAQAQEDYNLSAASPAAEDTKRYLGMVEFGYLYGKTAAGSLNSVASHSVQFFNGVRVHRLVALGVTVGTDFYNNVLVLPFALGIRGELADTRVSPFYSLDAGYGVASLSDDNEQRNTVGGWMYNPAVGLRVKTGNDTAFTFGVGYRYQRATIRSSGWSGNLTEEAKYKRLALRMGFMF